MSTSSSISISAEKLPWPACVCVFVLQGMLVTETVVDHIAKSLGMDPHVLRAQNLYKVKACWTVMLRTAASSLRNAPVVHLLSYCVVSIVSCRIVLYRMDDVVRCRIVPCRVASHRVVF